MKNILLLLFLSFFAFNSYGISEKIKNDNLILGQPTSGNSKSFSFDFGLGVLNPKFSSITGSNLSFNLPFNLDSTLNIGGDFVSTGNNFSLGDGTNTSKKQVFDIGAGASNPYFGYSSATGSLVFNNGVVEKKIGSGSGGGSGGVNLLSDSNNGFEDGKLTWVESGLTYSIVSYTNQSPSDLQYGSIVATVAAQKLTSASVNTPDNLGIGCEAQVDYNAISGNQNYTLKVFSGATLIGSQVLTGTGSWQKSSILPFPCSTAMTLVVEAAGVGNISIDNAYLGSTRNISNLDMIVTDWVNTGPVNITATTTNPIKGTTSVDNMFCRRVGDSLECRIEYRQTGSGVVGSGDYLFNIPTTFNGTSILIDLSKVTPYSALEGVGVYSLKSRVGGFSFINGVDANYYGEVSIYNTNSIRFGMRGGGMATTSSMGVISSGWGGLVGSVGYFATFKVPIQGWSVSPYKTYSPSVTDFYIEANLTEFGAILPTSTIFVEQSESTGLLENIKGVSSIPCVGNNSTGTTCSVGNEVNGIVFNVPVSGKYKVCLNTSIRMSGMGNLGSVKIAETFENNSTIIQNGNGISKFYSNNPLESSSEINRCDIFDFSAGRHTIKMFIKHNTGAVLIDSAVIASVNNPNKITYTVELVGQNIARPIIQNMVETSVSSGIRVESCSVINNGVASTNSANCNSWVSSLLRVGLGNVSINFIAGVFKAKPVCQLTSNNIVGCISEFSPNTTSSIFISVGQTNCTNNASIDTDFTITCIGAK